MKIIITVFLLLSLFTLLFAQNTNQAPNKSSAQKNSNVIPQSFQDQLTNFLLQIQHVNSQKGKSLASQLKKQVFQLYIMLVDYHQNGQTTYSQINSQVKIVLNIIDQIVDVLNSQTIGNIIIGSNNLGLGIGNRIEGNNNNVVGINNVALGNKNSAFGSSQTVSGNRNTVIGSNQFVVGDNLNVSGYNNYVLGSTKNIKQKSNTLEIGSYSINLLNVHKNTNGIVK